MCSNDDKQLPEELRSHKQLGEQLGLFHFADSSPGSAFWMPDGMRLWNALSDLWRELNLRQGYEEVRSPLVYDSALWKESGHWDYYRDGMFHFPLDGREWGLKPMNCPGHVEIYRARPRSYRELPLRLSEQGHVHRYELSGNVNGLLRARSFVIDDAHLFCREEQIEDEVRACLGLAADVYGLFGLVPQAELSLRPKKRFGDDALWDRAEGALRSALGHAGWSYDEVSEGGAFYGPKIDLHVSDALGRSWQLGSIQLDYVMPGRFGISYIGDDNKEHDDLVIVHRAMFGSFERFIAILLEHFDGRLPLWCAPQAVAVLPRGADDEQYADEIVADLQAAGVRAAAEKGGSLGKRIAQIEKRRIPLGLIVGPREREAREVSWRLGGQGENIVCDRDEAVARIAAAVGGRALAP